jgi:hypothetical protein
MRQQEDTMKHLFVLGLLLLAGCAAAPTMEELEAEAMQTGDWTKVEERELAQARRMGRAQAECPKGYAVFCKAEAEVTNQDCTCISRETQRAIFNESISVQPPNPSRTE